MNSTVFTTGQFAKLCGVSKDTILLYDKVGVLKPTYVSNEGYRYYSLRQSFLFNHISILNQSGLTLQEIRDCMDNADERVYRKVLVDALENLKAEKSRINHSIDFLESSIISITDSIDLVHTGSYAIKFSLEQHPERGFLTCASNVNMMEASNFIGKINKAIAFARDAAPGYAFADLTILLSREDLLGGNCTNASLALRMRRSKSDVLFDNGLYLSAIYHGDYKNIPQAFVELKNYIEDHHFTVLGDVFAECHFVHQRKDKRLSLPISVENPEGLSPEELTAVLQDMRFEYATTFNVKASVMVDPVSFSL